MKPRFIRQDTYKKKRLGGKWKRPKGLHSKTRNNFKGHRKNISVGYKAPPETRGLVKNLENVVVYTLKQIENINPKVQGISIATSVGLKNKILLVEKAKERGIKILNIKNPDEFIARKKDKKAKRKRVKKKETPKPEEKPKAKELPKEEVKPEEKPQEEAKEENAKEEYEKILTKRN